MATLQKIELEGSTDAKSNEENEDNGSCTGTCSKAVLKTGVPVVDEDSKGGVKINLSVDSSWTASGNFRSDLKPKNLVSFFLVLLAIAGISETGKNAVQTLLDQLEVVDIMNTIYDWCANSKNDHVVDEVTIPAPDPAPSVTEQLSKMFTSVKIKKIDVDAEERKIKGELLDKYEEKMNFDVTKGIPLDKLDDYIDVLKKSFKLTDKFCAELSTMSYATSKEKLVYAVKIEDEFESRYGYIAMTKDLSSNTLSCAYAVYSKTLKLKLRTLENRKQTYLFNFIPVGEEVTYSQEKVMFGTQDIPLDRYMRQKALEHLKTEGIINEINYEDDNSSETSPMDELE